MMRIRSRIFFLGFCFLSPSLISSAGRRPPSTAAVNSMPAGAMMSVLPHVEKMADRYRMTVLTPEGLPHYLIEKSPKKIWLRLVRPTNDGSQILEGDSVIKEVRVVQRSYSADLIVKLGDDAVSNDVYFDEGKKKIVLDVFTSARINKQISEKPTEASRPVLSVRSRRVSHPKKEEKKIVALPETTIRSVKREPVISKRDDEVLVVIDAGHGGMDSGAIGTRGTLEKDINLEFAEALKESLLAQKKFRVIMTRERDEFIPLQERTRIANEAKADFFVSIHCNSSLSVKNTGFETYFLSPDATDKAAASVARLENSVVALESRKGEESTKLNALLASMAIGNFINESSKFASLLCRNVRSHTSQDIAEVKEADFFVLRGAQMPAVLVELEYLSNPITELKLRSSRYRNQLVKGVVEGIKNYERQSRQEREAMASQSPPKTLVDVAR